MAGRLLDRLLVPLDAAARWVVVACMAAMAGVVSAQVFTRYALNGSIDWADEVSRLAFVWSIFLGMALGVRDGVHVALDLLVARAPAPLRRALLRATSLLCAALLGLVAALSVTVARVTWSERLGSIDLTSASFFLPVAIGSAHAALHFLRLGLGGAPAAEAAA